MLKKTKADDYVYPSDIENENSEIEQSSDSEIQSNSSVHEFDGKNELAKEFQAIKEILDNVK